MGRLRYGHAAMILAILIAFAAIFLSGSAAANTTCPNPGERPAVASDAVVQNGTLQAGDCYNPNTVGISQTAEQAKAYLNSVPKNALSSCAPPNQQNIEKLNDTFAVCAAQFIQAYTQKYGSVYITSAFRDGNPGTAGNGSGQSANQCAGGAPNSNHTRGLAIDMYPSSGDFKTLWSFAIQNPQFGVCFPHEGQNGGLLDRPHLILAGIGGVEGSECAALGVTKPCSGAPVLNIQPAAPTYNNSDGTGEQGATVIPTNPAPVVTNPTSPVFNPTPSAVTNPVAATAPVVSTAQTPSACTPQYSCTNGTVYYQSDSCTTSVFQTCQYGCLGTICALATSTASSTAPNDILQQLISLNTTSATTASSSLSSNIYNIVQGIFSSQGTPSSQTTQFVQNPTYTSNTFTSSDQSGSDISSQNYAPFQQLLSTLKSLLTGFLSYLQSPSL